MNKMLMVVGGIVVLAIVGFGGYKVLHHFTKTAAPVAVRMQGTPTPTTQPANAVFKMTSKNKLGIVMTDTKGMTLYTYSKDTTGLSNCTGKCLTIWPAYLAPSVTGTQLPADVTVITRADGTMQYAYKGMPLYYYASDKDSGDAYGNGVGGVWSVVK